MDSKDLVLAVDGGGTKTTVLIANISSNIAIIQKGPGTNPNIYGHKGVNRLKELIMNAVNQSHFSNDDITAAVLGMAGISHPKYRPTLEELFDDIFPGVAVKLISDAEMAHRAIWGKERGITLLVGTGSIAIGEDEEGVLKRAGGYGYQIGDVGSGYWLGKSLLTHLITADRSKVGDFQDLRKMVTDHFKTTNFEHALELISGDNNVPQVASLARILIDIAEAGNSIALQILNAGIQGLKDLIDELTEDNDQSNNIGLHGSLITKPDFYRSLLLNTLRIDNWERAHHEAVFGGLIIINSVETLEELVNFKVEYG